MSCRSVTLLRVSYRCVRFPSLTPSDELQWSQIHDNVDSTGSEVECVSPFGLRGWSLKIDVGCETKHQGSF